jgi:polyketide cyclase/dehydrase/lipid transport protein
MPKVEMDVETTLPPERVREALLDFSDRRPEIWPGIARSLYEVYSVGDTTADVKEGTKSPGMTVWARERYDWSDPETIRWTVQESNFCAPGSYVSARIRPGARGGSAVHIEWNREPTSMKGRVAAFVIVRTKGKPVAGSFAKAMRKLEAAQGSV